MEDTVQDHLTELLVNIFNNSIVERLATPLRYHDNIMMILKQMSMYSRVLESTVQSH